MNCTDAEAHLTLYLYGELASEEREPLEAHLAGCGVCQTRLERSRRFNALLGGKASSAPNLLVRCRQALEESLDREQYGWRRLLANWLFAGIHPSPVLAALGILVFGFGLGWLVRPHTAKARHAGKPELQVSSLAGGDLGHITGISQVSPDPQTGQVRITVNAEHPVNLEGSLDNPRIQQILVDTVKGYGNPGIRLDTLDALMRQIGNPSVQNALLYALQHDPNTGVRLEALKSVGKMSWSPEVQQALIEAVQQDDNPGVRVTAIDELVRRALQQRDLGLLPVLQDFARGDSNSYVRVKALAAAQELEQGR